MSLTAREISSLTKIVSLASELLAGSDSSKPATKRPTGDTPSAAVRTRRTGKELVAFQKLLKAERKKGASVADMARRHEISHAYIYQLK